MPEIHRFALVTHSPDQMFDLVRDVARYPEFLPWVQAAEVHEQGESHQIATLDVRVAGLARRFTTRNTLVENRSLAMQLADGPFDELSGQWQFSPVGGGGNPDQPGSVVCDAGIVADAALSTRIWPGCRSHGR